jgi:nucleoside-diphosphate-sugar epimerase
MIIGSGLIASLFKREITGNFLIFASGVSNSQEKRGKEFKRERVLLRETVQNYPDMHFVYFSSCSIYDESIINSEYVAHKLEMESIVIKSCKNYNIFRLPQVVGKTKSDTLVSFLFESNVEGKTININRFSTRNLIDANDVRLICKYIIDNGLYNKSITNVASPFNSKVVNIVKVIEDITSKKSSYKLVDTGIDMVINIDKISKIPIYEYIFHEGYMEFVLKRFYREFYLTK